MIQRNSIDLTCKTVVELLTEYLSDTMPADDRALLEQHLLTCPPCTTYLGQLKATVALTGTVHHDAPAQTRDDLLTLFRDWKKK